jgi:hypothetical protein
LKNEYIWEIQKKGKLNSEIDMENMVEKISWSVKRFGKYGRKVSWKVKRYAKYGRKGSWKVKR